MKHAFSLLLALALALALIPAVTLADDGATTVKKVTVSTAEEFLAAIGSETEITLLPGRYDLSAAVSSGIGDDADDPEYCYSWEECYNGYTLEIFNCAGLSLIGSEGVEIVTATTYADVIRFVSCSDVLIKGITAGHIANPGSCTGNVLTFSGCSCCRVEDCRLYGCGVVGIRLDCMDSIDIVDCDLYSCSDAAVYASASAYVGIDSCRIYDLGSADWEASAVFCAYNCYGFSVVNCAVHDNTVRQLLNATYTEGAYIGGCAFSDNKVTDSVFSLVSCSPVIESCSFGLPAERNWFNPEWDMGTITLPVDRSGNELNADALAQMVCEQVTYDGNFESPMPDAPEGRLIENGQMEYRVSTVDELLAAIGSDRIIVLEQPLYTLSDATGYGAYSGRNWFWRDNYDGPGLVIRNVTDLTIRSDSGASVVADPRYAEVITFENCVNVVLENLTLGHTVLAEASSCSGGVVSLSSCDYVTLSGCRLYGCGIIGLSAYECTNITLTATEIYDCSNGAIRIEAGWAVTVDGCNIHDCGAPALYLSEDSGDFCYEGIYLNPGSYSPAR